MAQGIEDAEVRRQITSRVIEHVRQRQAAKKTPPKNPNYWLSRTINAAFRKELDSHAIARPNTFTEDVHSKIKQLVRGRVPRYLEDAVVRNVFERFRNEVEPIQNLEHWANSVIPDARIDAIREETGIRKESPRELPKHGTDEEVYSTIKQLVRGRVPQYLEDAVVRNVFERFKIEVEPIQNLEHWVNSVISDICTDAIRQEIEGGLPKNDNSRQSNEEHDPFELLLYFLDRGLLSRASQGYREHLRVCSDCQRQLQDAAEHLGEFTDRAGYEELSLECVKMIRKLGLNKCAVQFLLESYRWIEKIEDVRDSLAKKGYYAVTLLIPPSELRRIRDSLPKIGGSPEIVLMPLSGLPCDSRDQCKNPEDSIQERDGDSHPVHPNSDANPIGIPQGKFIRHQLKGRHRQNKKILNRTLRLLGYRGSPFSTRGTPRRVPVNQRGQIMRFIRTVKDTTTLWLLIRKDAEITYSTNTIDVAAQPRTLDAFIAMRAVSNPDSYQELLQYFGRRK